MKDINNDLFVADLKLINLLLLRELGMPVQKMVDRIVAYGKKCGYSIKQVPSYGLAIILECPKKKISNSL